MPVCFKCQQSFSIDNLEKQIKHFHHEADRIAYHECVELGCNRKFMGFRAYRFHWSATHYETSLYSLIELKRSHGTKDSNKNNQIIFKSDDRNIVHTEEKRKIEIVEEFKRFVATKTVNMYKCDSMSYKGVQESMTDSKDILFSGLDIVLNELKENYGNGSGDVY